MDEQQVKISNHNTDIERKKQKTKTKTKTKQKKRIPSDTVKTPSLIKSLLLKQDFQSD